MTCKFINIDDPTIIASNPYNIMSVFAFDYCNNNPVMNIDPDGFWSYNRNSAIVYARTNAYNYNKLYYKYSRGDCTNFVSQCLYAGGLKMDSQWHSYRYTCWATKYKALSNNQRYNWDVSEAWRLVVKQYKYLQSSGYVDKVPITIRRLSDIEKAIRTRKISPGDVIYFRNNKNDGHKGFYLNHAAIITKKYGLSLYYCAHTKPRSDYNLKHFFNSNKYGVAYILHFLK